MARERLGSPMSVQLRPADDGLVRDIAASGGSRVNNSSVVRQLVSEAFENRRERARAGEPGTLPPVGNEPTKGGSGFSYEEMTSAVARLCGTDRAALSCSAFEAALPAYYGGELDVQSCIAFNLHARQCGDCNALVVGQAPPGFIIENITTATSAPDVEGQIQ